MNDPMEIVNPQNEYEHLEPCPFCGCDEVVYMSYASLIGLRWMVTCCGCMATIDPGYAQNKYTVQQMWNRRSGK